jgi:hypothetical protein
LRLDYGRKSQPICVSGIRGKSKLPQRLIGTLAAARSCLSEISRRLEAEALGCHSEWRHSRREGPYDRLGAPMQCVEKSSFRKLFRGGAHPERSRFSGGAKDLAWSASTARAGSLGPLEKTRVIGMTPHPWMTSKTYASCPDVTGSGSFFTP